MPQSRSRNSGWSQESSNRFMNLVRPSLSYSKRSLSVDGCRPKPSVDGLRPDKVWRTTWRLSQRRRVPPSRSWRCGEDPRLTQHRHEPHLQWDNVDGQRCDQRWPVMTEKHNGLIAGRSLRTIVFVVNLFR